MDTLRHQALAHGYFTRGDALRAGFDDNGIRHALRSRAWSRVRYGVYTFPDVWSALDDAGRHVATARAVVHKLGTAVAMSHTSAALVHGLDVWDADLSVVHVTRLDGGAGRTEAGVQHHENLCLSDELTTRDGHLVTSPVRAALECASLLDAEAAVAVLDGGLHHGLFTVDQLHTCFAALRYWPGTLHLQFAVRFADGRAESIGESRSRYLFYAHGLPAPQLQFPVYDGRGQLVGITDFAWPAHQLLGEFDGKVKYSRFLRPGEEPGDAVFREKQREDALRRITGWSVVRLTWADLYRGPETAASIRRMLRSAA